MARTDALCQVEALLSKGIGLEPRSVGSSMVAIAVQTRRRKREVGSDAEYLALVVSSPAEFQALIEEIVVPETWFFRDRESFVLLAAWAREWFSAHPFHVMRLLSAPCASGEEPYSIVMTLLETGVTSDRFSVEAMDISAVALEKARRATYGRNSFRGQPLDFRETCFEKVGQGWRLNPAIARQVHFRQSNLIEADLGWKEGELDVIFCRNLLIYFDAASRKRVMTRLGQLLAPGGVLFLGHAEGGVARDFGFEPIPSPMAFAFRKAPRRKGRVGEKPLVALKVPPRHPAPLPAVPVPAPRPLPPAPKKGAAPAVPRNPEQELALAQRLADKGQVEQARAACRAALESGGASARVYYLLALIEEAAGEEALAEEYYRKTLYIEPDHEEALIQLSLLEKKQGMTKAARLLEERALRVRARRQPQPPKI